MSDQGALSILYVDDDKDIRHIVKIALSLDPQLDLRLAGSGDEALALLSEGKWRPDVVLLDVMMPGMNGPAVMRTMREDHGLRDAPFIFITAMGRENDVASYRELGAGIILKPFDPINLAQRIRAIVASLGQAG